jgi:membrane-associated phospholipid phosphatase
MMERQPGADDGPRRWAFFWPAWTVGILVWKITLALCSPYDLMLSRAVVDYQSLYGQIVSRFGEWPSWGLIVVSVVFLVVTRRGASRGRSWRPLMWSVIYQALFCPALLTQSLKFLWGRVRFVHLKPDFSDYTPFYLPAGLLAGESFPSGHVAMAGVPMVVPFFLSSSGRGVIWLVAAWIPVLLYALGVAWGRIVFGKHFLTDTLFSIGASALLSSLLVRWRVRQSQQQERYRSSRW